MNRGLSVRVFAWTVLAIISTAIASLQAQVTLVPLGATWKYLVTPTAPAGNWTHLNFNDASWPQGPAKLGYGNGDEVTAIGFGPDSNNKYPTTYFRHRFSVGNRVDYKNQLDDLTWTALAAPFVATAPEVSVTDELAGQPHRFYRIVQVD